MAFAILLELPLSIRRVPGVILDAVKKSGQVIDQVEMFLAGIG